MTTLARLSLQTPAVCLDEFARSYEKQVVPILKKHGLVESAEGGRLTVEGVFSRLFEVETPAVVQAAKKALHQDPAWGDALRRLEAPFGDACCGGPVQSNFGLYRAPAGPGRCATDLAAAERNPSCRPPSSRPCARLSSLSSCCTRITCAWPQAPTFFKTSWLSRPDPDGATPILAPSFRFGH